MSKEEKKGYPEGDSNKERFHSFKSFARVNSIIYTFLTTIILGIVIGYILDRNFDGDYWMLGSIIVSFIIGGYTFFRQLLRLK